MSAAARYVATASPDRDASTHGLREGWTYAAPGLTRCGHRVIGVEHRRAGIPIEITCGSCVRLLSGKERTRE